MVSTPLSLLERLRLPNHPNAEADWERLVDLFAPLLYHWAQQAKLNDQDAADLVQEIFLKLFRELPTFEHKGRHSFRSWLRTLLLHLWHDRYRLKDSMVALRGDFSAPDSRALQEAAEFRSYLAQQALRLMQRDFEPSTWRACWETKVRGRPTIEVAAELGLTPEAVHAATYRVLKRLREELRGFLDYD